MTNFLVENAMKMLLQETEIIFLLIATLATSAIGPVNSFIQKLTSKYPIVVMISEALKNGEVTQEEVEQVWLEVKNMKKGLRNG